MGTYDPRAYPAVAVTVDLCVLTIRDDTLRVLLIERGEDPYRGAWALPGGFVRPEENLDEAAARELREETGLDASSLHPTQCGAYGDPKRDPRLRVVTVAYLAIAPNLPTPQAGSDAAGAAWTLVAEALDGRLPLAFDHERILRDAVNKAGKALEDTTLATAFCPPEFTVATLRRVYEIVWNRPLDARNFHRKATGADGFIIPTGSFVDRPAGSQGGRPAAVYRAGPATALYPPLRRPEGPSPWAESAAPQPGAPQPATPRRAAMEPAAAKPTAAKASPRPRGARATGPRGGR